MLRVLFFCVFSVAIVVVVHGGWLSVMGFLSWFCVDTKVFELSVAEGASFLRLVEKI